MSDSSDEYIKIPLNLTLDDVKRIYVLAILEKNLGNKTWTAEQLKVSRRIILNWANIWKYNGYRVPVPRLKYWPKRKKRNKNSNPTTP